MNTDKEQISVEAIFQSVPRPAKTVNAPKFWFGDAVLVDDKVATVYGVKFFFDGTCFWYYDVIFDGEQLVMPIPESRLKELSATMADAISFVDELIYKSTGKHLSEAQTDLVKYCWNGLTYPEMNKVSKFSARYLGNVAYRLFASLSVAAGEAIKKQNFRDFINKKKRDLINNNML